MNTSGDVAKVGQDVGMGATPADGTAKLPVDEKLRQCLGALAALLSAADGIGDELVNPDPEERVAVATLEWAMEKAEKVLRDCCPECDGSGLVEYAECCGQSRGEDAECCGNPVRATTECWCNPKYWLKQASA